MAFKVRLPRPPGISGRLRPPRSLDIVDGTSTAGQRKLRRGGLAEFEPATMPALLALFERARKGFVFFDVGANIGLYSLLCDALFSPSRIVAFEPTPATAQILRKLVRRNGATVDVHETALGDSSGIAELYLSDVSDASNSLAEGFRNAVGTETVTVERLDDFVTRTRIVPDVIKVDVETYEAAVLRGGRSTIAEHRPTLVVEALQRAGTDYGDHIMDAIGDLGYRYYQLTAYTEFEPAARVTAKGSPSGARDWLLSPEPLPADFLSSYEAWQLAVEACGRPRASGKAGERIQAALRALADPHPAPRPKPPPGRKARRHRK